MSSDAVNNEAKSPLRFTVPGQFTELPLDEDPEARIKRTYERLSGAMRSTDDTQRMHLVFMQEYMLTKLITEGAVYAALCVCRSEANPASLSAAQFAIFIKHVKLSGESPLAAVAGGIKKPGEPRETAYVHFPAGEGLVIGEELRVDSPVTVSGRIERNTSTVRQAQVLLPFPSLRKLAILSISTTFIDDWVYYAGMLNDIAHSVSFTEKNESIAERLSGAL